MQFLSNKKNLFSIAVVVLLVVGLLVTYYLVQKRQDIRNRASGGTAGFGIRANTQGSVQPGQQFTIDVVISAVDGAQISAADVTVTYPQALLRVDNAVYPNNSFFRTGLNASTQQILEQSPVIQNGTVHLITGTYCDDNQKAPQLPQPYKCYPPSFPTSNIVIAQLTVTALAQGSAHVGIDPQNSKMAEVGVDTNIATSFSDTDITIANPTTPPATPVGSLDIADCSQIVGWTCSAQNYNQALTVYLYEQGSQTPFATPVANVSRPDLVGANACGGTGNHGFAIQTPDALKDGNVHNIVAYSINPDGSGNNPVLGTPKTLQCSAQISNTPTPLPTNIPTTVPTGNPTAVPSQPVNGGNISVTIGLQGITKDTAVKPNRLVSVELRQGTTVVKTFSNLQVQGSKDGSYNTTLTDIPAGTYDLYVKAVPYLQKKFANVTVTNGQTTQLNVVSQPLLVGDFVGFQGGTTPPDNDITLADIGAILSQYIQLDNPVTANNQIYDLNADNTINLVDIGFLLTNYKALDNFGDK